MNPVYCSRMPDSDLVILPLSLVSMLLSEFSKLFENPFGLKKVAKMSEFQRFIKWEMVCNSSFCRQFYTNAFTV